MSVLSCAVCVRANQLGRINQNAIGLPCQSKEKPRKALHSLAEVTSAAHSPPVAQLKSKVVFSDHIRTNSQCPGNQDKHSNAWPSVAKEANETWAYIQKNYGLTFSTIDVLGISFK